MLARNERGQTYPSGEQLPVRQQTVKRWPSRKTEHAIWSERWQLLFKIAFGIEEFLRDP